MNIKISTKISLFALALVLLTASILGVYSYYKQRDEVFQSVYLEKEKEVKLLSTNIKSKIDELKNDVSFLSFTPPISGLQRAIKNFNKDPLDGSTTRQWKDRLAIIFEEMLLAKENYFQIRLIGFQDKGRELVRVDRHGLKINRQKEVDLQKKGDRDYFLEALKVSPGKVYLSKFDVNQEFGKIEYPIQLVLRAAVPIYINHNEPFGIVIINMDYTKIFNDLRDILDQNEKYFVADELGNLLIHSDDDISKYYVESGFKKVEDVYPVLKGIYESKKEVMNFESSKNGQKIIVAQKLFFNELDLSKFLNVFLLEDKESLSGRIEERTRGYTLVLIFVTLLSLVLSYLFSRRFNDPLMKLTSFAEELGKGMVGSELEFSARDEFGILADTLNRLSFDLEAKNRELMHQQEALDASAIVAQTDTKGIINYVNDKFLEISKFSREELIGRSHRVINSGYHSKDFFHEMWETIKGGNTWKGEILNKAKDGALYWVDTTIYPVKSRSGEVEKFIAIRFDTTDKKLFLEKLQKANLETKTALRDKAAFFANMSHEIRTPLNGIVGFTDLILDDADTPSNIHNQVLNIKECSKSLLMIVNDILDVSKIEAGKLVVEHRPISMQQVMNSTLKIFEPQCKLKKLALISEYDDKIPKNLLGDSLRLRQILINLIGNAIKFTEEGRVKVEMRLTELQDERAEVEVSVSDTGIGISKENQSKLFKSYSQGDATMTRKFGGTGLGLSIASKLIELMGGHIWVESELGHGSKFSFKIQLDIVDEGLLEILLEESEREEVITDKNFSDLKVLVAEDNLLNQTLIKKLLAKFQIKNIYIASNGAHALNEAVKSRYDLVLMDVQMPEMNGLEATAAIRKTIKIEEQPIIIGLSANAFPEDIEKGTNAGMDDYLSKPIDKDKLLELLHKYFKTR